MENEHLKAKLIMNDIFVETREECEEVAWQNAERMCEAAQEEFLMADWHILHIVIQGGN